MPFTNSFTDYLFSASATTAASAIELTLTSQESARLVRITGAFVPVRIFPFFEGTK